MLGRKAFRNTTLDSLRWTGYSSTLSSIPVSPEQKSNTALGTGSTAADS